MIPFHQKSLNISSCILSRYLLICNPTIIPISSHYIPLYPIDYLLVLNTIIVVYPLMIIPLVKMIISLVILGADDTGLCGQFSRCFLAHDMGFMYRFCYGFFLHMTWELCADLTGRYFSILLTDDMGISDQIYT